MTKKTEKDKKKFLRKNEFREYKNSKYLTKSGNPHPAYISGRKGHKYQFNVITHSPTFFGKETKPLEKNPNRGSSDQRTSRFSVKAWDNDDKFSKEKLPKNLWRLSKKDKAKIKKSNKKQK